MLFRVLGSMQVEQPGDRPVEIRVDVQRRLLAVLLLNANRWVDANTLDAVLWPRGAHAAKGSIKTHVYQLRQLLPRAADGSPRINSRSSGYRLNLRRPELDAAVFEDLLLRAQSVRDAALAAELYRRALALWRGEPYEDLRDELGPLADAEVARLNGLVVAARDGLAGAVADLEREESTGTRPPELADDDTQRMPVIGGAVPPPEHGAHHAAEASPDAAPGPDGVGRPDPDRPQPWNDWRARRPPPKRRPTPRRRAARLFAGMAVLATVILLAVAALASGQSILRRVAGPPAPTPAQPAPEVAAAAPEPPRTPSPRRPIPGQPTAAQPPALLFGIGDRPDTARQSALVAGAPARMLTTWHNGPDDMPRYAGWRESMISQAYADGFAHHLVLADVSVAGPVDTALGQACGRPYSLSQQFLADAATLAQIFAGTTDSPPLFVSVFDGVQDYACTRGAILADQPTTAYYRALLGQYLAVREVFHQFAPNALVSLTWDAAMASYSDPAIGGGAAMFAHFADAMRLSDFVSIAAVGAGNAEHVRAAVDALGPYAPVMLAYYRPAPGPPAAVNQEVRAVLSDELLAEAAPDGLFAVSFLDGRALAAAPRAATFVLDVVRRHGRSPR